MILQKLTYKEIDNNLLEKIISIDNENISSYLRDPFTQVNGVVSNDDGEIIAVGLIRIVNEWKVIINKDISKFEVAKAIRELGKQAMIIGNQKGSNEVYAIITQGEDNYKELLKKHFGFKEINHQSLLKLEV